VPFKELAIFMQILNPSPFPVGFLNLF
jgi:hypothetical protein